MNHILVLQCGDEQFTIGNIWGGIIKDKYHTVKTLSISNRNIIEIDAKLIPQHTYAYSIGEGREFIHCYVVVCMLS
jgi:hypothetical protein